MSENWLPIKGWEDLYEVSNLGRVMNSRTGRVLKPRKTRNSYLQVGLCKNGVMKQYYIHRIVAETFIKNPDGFSDVNHIDENKHNNCVENLEWCTHIKNVRHGTCIERMIKTLTNGKNSKQVYQCTPDGELVRVWPSTAECGRNGFERSSVTNCCLNKRRTYKGYKWSYEPPVPPKAIEFLTK